MYRKVPDPLPAQTKGLIHEALLSYNGIDIASACVGVFRRTLRAGRGRASSGRRYISRVNGGARQLCSCYMIQAQL